MSERFICANYVLIKDKIMELIEKLRPAVETTALGVIEDVILDAGGTVDGHPRDGLITYNNADGEIVLEVTIDDDITTFALYTHTGDDFDPRWIADIYKVNRKTGYRHWDYNVDCGELGTSYRF